MLFPESQTTGHKPGAFLHSNPSCGLPKTRGPRNQYAYDIASPLTPGTRPSLLPLPAPGLSYGGLELEASFHVNRYTWIVPAEQWRMATWKLNDGELTDSVEPAHCWPTPKPPLSAKRVRTPFPPYVGETALLFWWALRATALLKTQMCFWTTQQNQIITQ